MKRVLVTGGNGFIGKALIASLCHHYKVTITQRTHQSIANDEIDSIVTGDLSEFRNWDNLLEGVDFVVHLASCAHKSGWKAKGREEADNKVLEQLLISCKRSNVKKFLFMSTAQVHGKFSDVEINEDTAPCFNFGKSIPRLKGEFLVREFCEGNAMEYVIVRPALVLSANAPGNIQFLSKLAKVVRLFPFKSCLSLRSYVSLEKLVLFIEVCLRDKRANSNVYLLSDDRPKSLTEVLDFLACERKIRLFHFHFPEIILRLIFRSIRKKELETVLFEDFIIDSSKANNLIYDKKA